MTPLDAPDRWEHLRAAAASLVGTAPEVIDLRCARCAAPSGRRCFYRNDRDLPHAARVDRGRRARARHAGLCAALADAALALDEGGPTGNARAAATSRHRELVRLTRAAGLRYRLPSAVEVREFALVSGWPAQATTPTVEL